MCIHLEKMTNNYQGIGDFQFEDFFQKKKKPFLCNFSPIRNQQHFLDIQVLQNPKFLLCFSSFCKSCYIWVIRLHCYFNGFKMADVITAIQIQGYCFNLYAILITLYIGYCFLCTTLAHQLIFFSYNCTFISIQICTALPAFTPFPFSFPCTDIFILPLKLLGAHYLRGRNAALIVLWLRA